jgi:hypothetical protein
MVCLKISIDSISNGTWTCVLAAWLRLIRVGEIHSVVVEKTLFGRAGREAAVAAAAELAAGF